MDIVKFLKRTAAILTVLAIVFPVLWLAAVKPVFTWWPEIGFKALLIPVAVIALIVLAIFLWNWAMDTLQAEADLDEDDSLNLAEWIVLAQVQFGDLKRVREALDNIIGDRGPGQDKPVDATKP